jgi:energy-coupling factor transporter ATP-binding protein EcfA2
VTDPRPFGSGVRVLPGEPIVQRWRAETYGEVAARLVRAARRTNAGPVVVAIDGRSGSGKTTLAEELAGYLPGSVILHTDDISWYESFFGWDHLMAARVLLPLRRGSAVHFRPPAWDRRGREGAITVPAGVPFVIVEGVGSSRRSLGTLLDISIWVQADHEEAWRRGVARDGGSDEAAAFWEEWGRAEDRFLAEDRPWERASLTVCGTPDLVPPDDIDPGPQAALTALLGADAAPSPAEVLTAVAGRSSGELACRC